MLKLKDPDEYELNLLRRHVATGENGGPAARSLVTQACEYVRDTYEFDRVAPVRHTLVIERRWRANCCHTTRLLREHAATAAEWRVRGCNGNEYGPQHQHGQRPQPQLQCRHTNTLTPLSRSCDRCLHRICNFHRRLGLLVRA